ncbi:sensor histidine kinase [Jhaorihella thermophila]
MRHTPAGTEIRVATGRDATGPWLEVSDTGPGIPESERDAVFRRLYRLESSRTTPGSGLGLSLVRAIADLHEARIELSDNRPGLRVMIHFPPSPPTIKTDVFLVPATPLAPRAPPSSCLKNTPGEREGAAPPRIDRIAPMHNDQPCRPARVFARLQ